jgi:octaprenyl-diphosphate synthase
MSIDEIGILISSERQGVDAHIQARLQSDVALVNQLGHYIVNSGGKRLRPVLLLLSARAFGYQGFHHTLLAAVVEFIHTATLLHDDVVDESDLRRGNDTANALYGNAASVLVGDFLYSRAFQMMVEAGSMRVMEVLSEATNVIAEGEVMQLMNCNDPDTSENNYLEVIRCKTAKLFEAASQLGAIISEASENDIKAMATYGMHLGTAFQLIDDALDYTASSEEMGKNVGDDLAEGKPTLPLIYAMREGSEQQAQVIRNAIEQGGRDHIDEVIQIIQDTGAIAYTIEAAKKEAQVAIQQLENLADSPYKTALVSLAEFSVNRNH